MHEVLIEIMSHTCMHIRFLISNFIHGNNNLEYTEKNSPTDRRRISYIYQSLAVCGPHI